MQHMQRTFNYIGFNTVILSFDWSKLDVCGQKRAQFCEPHLYIYSLYKENHLFSLQSQEPRFFELPAISTSNRTSYMLSFLVEQKIWYVALYNGKQNLNQQHLLLVCISATVVAKFSKSIAISWNFSNMGSSCNNSPYREPFQHTRQLFPPPVCFGNGASCCVLQQESIM